MDAGEVRTRMLAQFGIRIEPAMSRYVLRQLRNGAGDGQSVGFPVMGGDARTGAPVRRTISATAFDAALSRIESSVAPGSLIS